MTKAPTEFYTAYRWFSAYAIRASQDGWGQITDGLSDRDEAIEALIDSFDRVTRAMGMQPTLETVLVVKINLGEGTSRDVTEDVLAEMEALRAMRMEERGLEAAE